MHRPTRIYSLYASLTCAIASVFSGPVSDLPALPRPIPHFVLDFAPLSHLWSQEKWFPSDIATHLTHVTPEVNFTAVPHFGSVTFANIARLGSDVFLTSKDPVEDVPEWMLSTENKPDNLTAFSRAPATIIVTEKKIEGLEGKVLDAFYFYFYSFNEGSTDNGIEFDDHIGDWEHTMIRFLDSKPSLIYLSAHTGGFAFNYSTLQTTNGRATTFIAGGTHANYATPGSHPHGDNNALNDRTDAGPVWDVTLNFRGYWLDDVTQKFSLAKGVGIGAKEELSEGVGWLEFEGMWGDQQYPVPEHGQFCVQDDCHFTDGPTGPIGKNLTRVQVCEHADCTILSELPPVV